MTERVKVTFDMIEDEWGEQCIECPNCGAHNYPWNIVNEGCVNCHKDYELYLEEVL